MKPALSLVFFTVLSGAGLGLAATLALFPAMLSERGFTTATALSLLLLAGGLGASTTHLANPKNAWRAVMRVRTSWLSREAVLAAVFFPLLLGYALTDSSNLWLRLLVGSIALLTVFCTAMIYQSLKTIAQWHHPSVAVNYLLLALMSGGVLFNGLIATHQPNGEQTPALLLTALITALAAAGKVYHYRRIGTCRDIRVGNATGFSRAQARLLDAGHTGPTFLTREFVYHRPAALLKRRRQIALLSAFPAAWLALLVIAKGLPLILAGLFIAVMFAGVLLERWLFFAEAHHSVRAYHGVD